METKRIAALVAALVAAANSVMAILGLPQLEMDEATVYNVVSAVAMVVTWGTTIWMNFPFTREAKVGQAFIDKLKDERKAAGNGTADR